MGQVFDVTIKTLRTQIGVSSPSSAPDFNFLLMYNLEGRDVGSSSWISTTHVGELH